MRTDPDVPSGPLERSYTVQTHYDTDKTKAQNLQDWGREIWALYQNDLDRETSVGDLVTDCETLLAEGLNAKEA